jgi:prevent-host-death family protein
MNSFGTNEAKTHFSELLRRVEKGERFTITRRGRPVAMLIPAAAECANVGRVAQDMLRWRDTAGPRLGSKLTIRQLVKQGRRS